MTLGEFERRIDRGAGDLDFVLIPVVAIEFLPRSLSLSPNKLMVPPRTTSAMAEVFLPARVFRLEATGPPGLLGAYPPNWKADSGFPPVDAALGPKDAGFLAASERLLWGRLFAIFLSSVGEDAALCVEADEEVLLLLVVPSPTSSILRTGAGELCGDGDGSSMLRIVCDELLRGGISTPVPVVPVNEVFLRGSEPSSTSSMLRIGDCGCLLKGEEALAEPMEPVEPLWRVLDGGPSNIARTSFLSSSSTCSKDISCLDMVAKSAKCLRRNVFKRGWRPSSQKLVSLQKNGWAVNWSKKAGTPQSGAVDG